MKKLIGIFAAIALVGAVSAAPKKAPAKPAPAKAAAPAPAAVAPAPAAVAPTAKSAPSAGIGLSVELRGSFSLSNGSSESKADGTIGGASTTQKLSNANGFGGGLTVGYEIAKDLGLVASFDYRSISSREWSQKNAAGTVNQTIKSKKDTMVIGLGLRPEVKAWGGTIYAGAGLAILLPYSDTASLASTGAVGLQLGNLCNATLGACGPNPLNGGKSAEIKSEWNLGIGVYGELGYNYSITDSIYLGVGVRALVVTSNNDGKSTTVTKDGADVAGMKQNYSTTLTGAANEAAYKSDGTTDLGFNINVGFRF